MNKKIFIELFQFDAKMDYNPYYKKYEQTINEETSLLDLLNTINNIETFEYKSNKNFAIQANGLFTKVTTKVSEILLGDTLILEPLNIRRAIKDLIIDTKDFEDKLMLLNNYINFNDIEEIKDKYLHIYYASNTLNFNYDYIGEHILLISHALVENNIENQKELLHILFDDENGIFYHTSIENRVFPIDKEIENQINSLLSLSNDAIPRSTHIEILGKPQRISQTFDNFNIAIYTHKNTKILQNIITNAKAKVLTYCSKYYDIAFHMKDKDKKFVYKLAGQILLDAYDKNADFLIIEDTRLLDIFDKEQKNIESIVGREINLPVITSQQFAKLIEGEKNIKTLGFDKHKVKIKFL